MPDQAAVEVSGDRWTLVLRRDIVFGDKRYYRELHAGGSLVLLTVVLLPLLPG